MKIKTASFIISNTDVNKCPKNDIPEYAFIGRSNVGKSSLINMITDHSKLAKTSGTPGKTQLINHFMINDQWFLVDLPGYGYARVSKKLRSGFQGFIKDYFEQRQQLACTFVLVDCRHAPQKIDLEFMEYLGENGIPFAIVFTKTDKIKLSELNKNIAFYERQMTQGAWAEMPKWFVSSASTSEGKKEILNYIDQINVDLSKL
ncbi:MAG: YihA family ribosome biogenesis GTP-binding protein [Flavobacteriaceae bacterium]|nr:MAG: YihA family ribosome biogenesis GTP-binding protein [Flavobacteriaceae bacterium]